MKSKIQGNVIDLFNRKITPATLHINGPFIESIEPDNGNYQHYILPGFTDAHIHIESSMLVPYEFARMALPHGTVSTVSDPHEIANVCGVAGVDYMIDNARNALLKFNFGAPSCVPATAFETSGAVIDAIAVDQLLSRKEIVYLSEMMNYPGVLHGDAEVMKKIAAAHKHGKPVDGHAPGLRSHEAQQYIAAGITTDHECFTLDEALEKLSYGMKILIREGSAAKNFEALHSLISTHTKDVMLCSDDLHPDNLMEGHINLLVKRALQKGHHLFDVLQCACVNPVQHYHLDTGLLRPGHKADFIVIDHPDHFNILKTYVNGQCVAENGQSVLSPKKHKPLNQFCSYEVVAAHFAVKALSDKVKAIEAIDGQLITPLIAAKPLKEKGYWHSNVADDVLKIAVINRYQKSDPVVGFVKNFGIKEGAIASTVAHDSHNIIVVGVDDESLAKTTNLLMETGGGLSAVSATQAMTLPLPVAGLMSIDDGHQTGQAYAAIDALAKQMGSQLKAPFMTLSFMALLVIPHFKIGDKGLFDADRFALTTLEYDE